MCVCVYIYINIYIQYTLICLYKHAYLCKYHYENAKQYHNMFQV